MNYRKSSMEKAGFKEFPKDTAGFLELCKALKKNNTPAGFALGHASGDANTWLHWVLWAHGGIPVDKNDKVIINSPETAKALEYAKALYETFIPGTASWNDSSNNKAFLAGDLHLTANGISIYVAAKDEATSKTSPTTWTTPMADRAGRQADRVASLLPDPGLQVHQVPEGLQGVHRLHAGEENFNPWCRGAQGYLTHSLNAYDKQPGLDRRSEDHVFSDAASAR